MSGKLKWKIQRINDCRFIKVRGHRWNQSSLRYTLFGFLSTRIKQFATDGPWDLFIASKLLFATDRRTSRATKIAVKRTGRNTLSVRCCHVDRAIGSSINRRCNPTPVTTPSFASFFFPLPFRRRFEFVFERPNFGDSSVRLVDYLREMQREIGIQRERKSPGASREPRSCTLSESSKVRGTFRVSRSRGEFGILANISAEWSG